MGKDIRNDKLMLLASVVLSLVLLAAPEAKAAYLESELFDRGYDYYLSYQPDKAVEAFNTFLSEFPDSSSRDAAMFWLGKSLVQLRSFDEARKIFSEIMQRFPNSPYLPHVEKELEAATRSENAQTSAPASADAEKGKDALVERMAEVEKRTELTEKELSKAVEERERLRLQLEEERKRTEDMKAKVATLEKKEAELATLRVDQKERGAIEEKLSEIEKKTGRTEGDLLKALAETDKLRLLLEEERRKTEEIRSKMAALEKKEVEPAGQGNRQEKIALEEKLAEIEKKTLMTESDLSKAVQEREALRVQFETERKNREEMTAKMASIEKKESEMRKQEPREEKKVSPVGNPAVSGEEKAPVREESPADLGDTIQIRGKVAKILEEEKAIVVKDENGKAVTVFFENDHLFSKVEKGSIVRGDKVVVRYLVKGKRNICVYIRSLAFC